MARAKEIWFRIKICWGILFGRHDHFTLISYSKKEFINVLSGCKSRYKKVVCNMPDFIFFKAIKKIAEEKTDTDLILEQANFEAENFVEQVESK